MVGNRLSTVNSRHFETSIRDNNAENVFRWTLTISKSREAKSFKNTQNVSNDTSGIFSKIWEFTHNTDSLGGTLKNLSGWKFCGGAIKDHVGEDLVLKFNTYVINSYRYTKLRMSLSESSYDAFDCKDRKTLGSTGNLNHSLCISEIF